MELYFTDHSDNSTLICYTVSSFECKYFNTKEKNIQDFSQQWAEYLRTKVSNSLQYAEDYNLHIDKKIDRVARAYMIERLKNTSLIVRQVQPDDTTTQKFNDDIYRKIDHLTAMYLNERTRLIDLKIPSLSYKLPENKEENIM